MSEHSTAVTERLVALERSHAAQQAELAALRRRLAGRRGTTLARALASALVVALLATPLGLLAASFTDLNGGSPHNASINAIADAGISKGCNPAGTLYCPNDLVTREQMASFLARTAGIGGNPPIANAATAVNAQNAANAATLGGRAPSALVRTAMARKTTDTNLSTSFTAELTLTIVAPTAGFLHVTSSVVTEFTPQSSAKCIANHYLRDDQGTGPNFAATGYHPVDLGTEPLTTSQTYVFAVQPGTRVVTLNAKRFCPPAAGPLKAKEMIITALFVPFGYNGGATLAP